MKPGERIREFRENQGFDQKGFAEILGFSRGYISQIENDIRRSSGKFRERFYEIFKISIDYVLYGRPLDQATPDLTAPCEGKQYKEEREIPIFRDPKMKYQVLPTATKKLIDNLIEILESDNEVMVDLFKANIKAILEAVRMSQKTDENKSKGSD